MASFPVIPYFYILENSYTRLFPGLEFFIVHHFCFHRFKKLSATALSQQFPFLLILCMIGISFSCSLNSAQAY